MDCPACGQRNPPSARHCMACDHALGAASVVKGARFLCPNCAADCVRGTKFCAHCGARLRGNEHPAAPVPADYEMTVMIMPDSAPRGGAAQDSGSARASGAAEPGSGRERRRAKPSSTATGTRPGAKGGNLLLVAAALVLLLTVGGVVWYLLKPAAAPHADSAAWEGVGSAHAETPVEAASSALPPAMAVADGATDPVTSAALAVPAAEAEREVEPAASLSAPRPVRTLYRDACAACHERGEGGAPRTSRMEDWNGLLQASRATLVARVMDGHGGAPARAGVALEQEEARQLVAHLATLIERNNARVAAERAKAAPAPVAAEARPAAPPPPAPAASDWLAELRGELGQCAQLGFFARVGCEEKARWRYCKERWNSVPECAVGQQNEPGMIN